jgi:hypothetical protein
MKRNRKRFTSFSSAEAEKPDYFFRFVSLDVHKIYCFASQRNKKYNVFCFHFVSDFSFRFEFFVSHPLRFKFFVSFRPSYYCCL